MRMLLNSNISEGRIEEIRALYYIAFPPEERMPFEMLLNKTRTQNMRLYAIESFEGEFIGFATITLCAYDALVLSYFAILPEKRGQGYGSECIRLIIDKHPDKSIVIDIEDDGVSADNTEQRVRRKEFYTRLGFSVMPYRLKIFGVPSLIMSSSREYSYEEYRDIFEQTFSKFALERLVLNED